MKLYTVVIHNLQICMKEYHCCLKFRMGDNSTYTFTKRGVVYLVLHTHLHVVYYNCVKFHKNSIICLVGVAFTRYMPQFILSRKGGGIMYLVSTTPPKRLIGFL
jgi:hypothetical protein